MRRNKKKSPNAVGKHGQHTMGAQASASFDRESPTPHASHAAASFGDGETPGSVQNPYSRRVTQAEYTKKRKSKKRKKIVLAVCIALLVVVLGGVGAAFAYINTINANLNEGVDDDLRDALVDTKYAGDPFYMLLMGTDGSEERSESAEYAGDQFRSDSMILARIDPQNKQVTMVSLHRDTLIDMGTNGKQKLNAAHSIGGAAYTIEVVSKFAGVPISHYAEIDFDGFKEVVDALGGVEVDVPMEINDEDAGGHLDAGLQTLNGDQALILCRARHAYDAYGDGDRYRAANQRLVLSAVAKKILSSDPITMANTIQALSKYITTDFNVTDIISLASSMQGLNTDTGIYSAMEPTTSKLVNGTWYEYVNEKEWQTMMQRVDQGLPPTTEDVIDEKNGTVLASTGDKAGATSNTSSTTTATRSGKVTVKNGANIDGAAATAATKIEKLGYTTETGNASSSFSTTVVVYTNDSQKEAAEEIVKQIGNGVATKNDGRYTFSTDFLVVIGSDWK